MSDILNVYEDSEFLEFLEERYQKILSVVKKVIEKVWGKSSHRTASAVSFSTPNFASTHIC